MSTVAQMVDNVRTNFKKDPAARVISDTVILAKLNEAQDLVEGEVFIPEMQSSSTVNLVASTQEYNLATDLVKLNLVRHQAHERILKEKSLRDIFLFDKDTTGVPEVYYVWGGSIGFYPTPSSNESAGVKYWYTRTLSELVESGAGAGQVTTTQINAKYHWVLERGAEMLCFQIIGDYDRANQAEVKFREGMEKMRQEYMSFSSDFDSEIKAGSTPIPTKEWLFNPYAT